MSRPPVDAYRRRGQSMGRTKTLRAGPIEAEPAPATAGPPHQGIRPPSRSIAGGYKAERAPVKDGGVAHATGSDHVLPDRPQPQRVRPVPKKLRFFLSVNPATH